MALDIGQPVRLGEWLVSRSLISRSDLFLALNFAQKRQCRLGDALVVMGLLERERVERESGKLLAAIAPKRSAQPTPPPLPAHAFRSRQTPPPLPAGASRKTPPPVPAAMRQTRSTPPPLPALSERPPASARPTRATPPPIPADAGPRRPDGEQVYLLTRRKHPKD